MKIRLGPKSLNILHFTDRQNTRSLTKPDQPTNFRCQTHGKRIRKCRNRTAYPKQRPSGTGKRPELTYIIAQLWTTATKTQRAVVNIGSLVSVLSWGAPSGRSSNRIIPCTFSPYLLFNTHV